MSSPKSQECSLIPFAVLASASSGSSEPSAHTNYCMYVFGRLDRISFAVGLLSRRLLFGSKPGTLAGESGHHVSALHFRANTEHDLSAVALRLCEVRLSRRADVHACASSGGKFADAHEEEDRSTARSAATSASATAEYGAWKEVKSAEAVDHVHRSSL